MLEIYEGYSNNMQYVTCCSVISFLTDVAYSLDILYFVWTSLLLHYFPAEKVGTRLLCTVCHMV